MLFDLSRRPLSPFRTGLIISSSLLITVIFLQQSLPAVPYADSITLLPSSTRSCNPYTRNGYLHYNPHNAHENRWTPFPGSDGDQRCVAPALVASLIRSSWASVPPTLNSTIGHDWANLDVGPDGRAWEDVEWARNKTVLLLGDSVPRYNLLHLCGMAGEEMIEVGWDHPLSPAKMETPPVKPEDERVSEKRSVLDTESKRDASDDDLGPRMSPYSPHNWHKYPPGAATSHQAHYCYIPGMDLLILNVFHFGLDEWDYWIKRGTYTPPYVFEDRLSMLAVEYIDRMRQHGRRSAPDVTYFGSGMWDLSRWAHEDLDAKVDPTANLTPGRISWYRTRVRQALAATVKAFPKSRVSWLTTHYPLRTTSGWFLEGRKADTKLNRLTEMAYAALSAWQDLGDATKEQVAALSKIHEMAWGRMMMGEEEHQVDGLHPRLLPGGYLFADMMLYDLREAVRSRWW